MVYENITDQEIRKRAARFLANWRKIHADLIREIATEPEGWKRNFKITTAYGTKMEITGFRRALELVNDL